MAQRKKVRPDEIQQALDDLVAAGTVKKVGDDSYQLDKAIDLKGATPSGITDLLKVYGKKVDTANDDHFFVECNSEDRGKVIAILRGMDL